MKKVYVVTSGQYSDYGINAVFSTPERTQAYIDEVNREESWRDFNTIEIYDLDGECGKALRPIFTCDIALADGTITPRGCSTMFLPAGRHGSKTWNKGHVPGVRPRDHQGFFLDEWDIRTGRVEACSTVSQKHAEKLAVECRQCYLRDPDAIEALFDDSMYFREEF